MELNLAEKIGLGALAAMGGYFLCGALCLCRSSRVRKLCFRRKGRSPPPSIVRSMQDIERGVRQCDSEVSDNEVSDNEVSDNEVSDNEVSDNEVSDNEVSDNEVSDNEVSDNEVSDNEVSDSEVSDNEVSDNDVSDNDVSDNEMSDNEMSDSEVSDSEVSDNEVSDNEVSDIVSAASINAADNASPRTSSPLNHLESAPVPNFIVETVPLKSILAKSVDPKVESTQKAKKSVHWGRELVRIKITMTDFQRLSKPRSDFKPWTAFPPLE